MEAGIRGGPENRRWASRQTCLVVKSPLHCHHCECGGLAGPGPHVLRVYGERQYRCWLGKSCKSGVPEVSIRGVGSCSTCAG